MCDSSYITSNHLKYHKNRAHFQERSHKCSTCNKAFLSEYDVMKHIKHVHLKERPFACTKCSSTYKNSWMLKKHMERHSGVYQYNCDLCKKGFSSSGKLIEHNNTRHNPDDEF